MLCVAAAGHLVETLRADVKVREEPVPQALNTRELDVLVRMEYQRDKAIAAALGLTYDGVRYRVRSIFAKLGTSRRHDAVRRARALGILPPAEGSGMGS